MCNVGSLVEVVEVVEGVVNEGMGLERTGGAEDGATLKVTISVGASSVGTVAWG